MTEPLYILLLGPQGAGKGTQAEYLRDHFGIPTLSVGAMFREEMKSDSEIGKRAAAFVSTGKLVPNDVTNGLLLERLKRDDLRKGVILDGYPRDLAQAEALAKSVKVSCVVAIEISDLEAIARLTRRLVCPKCGTNYNEVSRPPVVKGVCDKDGATLERRKDDQPDAIRDRLKTYHAETEPLLDYYGKQGIVARVNGEQPIVEVHEEMVTKMKDVCGIVK